LAGMPPAVLANARDVLARLERYELDVFADDEVSAPAATLTLETRAAAQGAGANESPTVASRDAVETAARRAGRRKAAAQASLFDLANQKVVEELLRIEPDKLSPEEAKELLSKLRERIV
jgi:DNA mismatch repair ATPase MutS